MQFFIKIPGIFFYRYRQTDSKIYKGSKWTRVAKITLKSNKVGAITLPYFKNYCKVK